MIVPGAEHNNTFMVGGTSYFDKLEEFYQKCCGEALKCFAQENIKAHQPIDNPDLAAPLEANSQENAS